MHVGGVHEQLRHAGPRGVLAKVHGFWRSGSHLSEWLVGPKVQHERLLQAVRFWGALGLGLLATLEARAQEPVPWAGYVTSDGGDGSSPGRPPEPLPPSTELRLTAVQLAELGI